MLPHNFIKTSNTFECHAMIQITCNSYIFYVIKGEVSFLSSVRGSAQENCKDFILCQCYHFLIKMYLLKMHIFIHCLYVSLSWHTS